MAGNKRQKKIKNTFVEEEKKEETGNLSYFLFKTNIKFNLFLFFIIFYFILFYFFFFLIQIIILIN